MCSHFTRASLVTSCVRRLRHHVRVYGDIALASGYSHIWKRRQGGFRHSHLQGALRPSTYKISIVVVISLCAARKGLSESIIDIYTEYIVVETRVGCILFVLFFPFELSIELPDVVRSLICALGMSGRLCVLDSERR